MKKIDLRTERKRKSDARRDLIVKDIIKLYRVEPGLPVNRYATIVGQNHGITRQGVVRALIDRGIYIPGESGLNINESAS